MRALTWLQVLNPDIGLPDRLPLEVYPRIWLKATLRNGTETIFLIPNSSLAFFS